ARLSRRSHLDLRSVRDLLGGFDLSRGQLPADRGRFAICVQGGSAVAVRLPGALFVRLFLQGIYGTGHHDRVDHYTVHRHAADRAAAPPRPRPRRPLSVYLRPVPDVFSQGNYAFRPFVALPLTTASLMLLLGIVVLARERASHISRLFFATACSIAAWLFAFSLMYATADARVALFWGKAAFLAIPFIPTAVNHFVVGLERKERRLHTALRAMWVLSAAFALLIVATNQIVDGMEHYPWGFYPRYAWASGPYLLFFFFGLGSALYHSIHTWKTAE